jgi:ABC-type multidrug transport system fused ATPase/permease subunit
MREIIKKRNVPTLIKVWLLAEKRLVPYLFTIFITGIDFPLIHILFAFAYKNVGNTISSGRVDLLLHAIYIVMIAVIIQCAIEPVANYINGRIVCDIVYHIRVAVFAHIERLPLSFFDTTPRGDILSRVNSDLNKFEPLYRKDLRNVIHAVSFGLGAICSMLALNVTLSLVVIAISLIITSVNIYSAKRIGRMSLKIQHNIGIMTQYFLDIVGGVPLFKFFHLKGSALKRYHDITDAIAKQEMHNTTTEATIAAVNVLMDLSNFLIILFLGMYFVEHGQSDYGTVVAFLFLKKGVSYMFNQFGVFWAAIQHSIAGAERVFDLMNIEEDTLVKDHCGEETRAGVITLEGVSFSYPDTGREILTDINLTIQQENIVLVTGESGAGKSTLFKLLLGLYLPTEGDIYIQGKPLKSYSWKSLRNQIAYVSQNSCLFSGTIFENIHMGNLDATESEIIHATKLANADEFIQELEGGYQHHIGEDGHGLSGGQMQRINIARAFLKDSPILLLDEPTSALDSDSEKNIRLALETLIEGRTVLIISHRKSMINEVGITYKLRDGVLHEQCQN